MSITFYEYPYGTTSKQSKLVGKPVFSSESATEPVTLTEAKTHLYIDTANTDFDAQLTALIIRVRQWVEEITALSLISRTVTIYVDYETPFNIPYGPATTLTSASVKTSIGTYEAKTSNSDFELDNQEFKSYIGNYRWKIVFSVTAAVPGGLKDAVLNEIANRFENRGDAVLVRNTDELVQPYKMLEWLV